MSVNLGGIKMNNPVAVASGTFGYGHEYEVYTNIAEIGAVIVKGTTLTARPGNPAPRIAETPAGMLNAIGLENPGVEVFLKEHLPYLREKKVTVIANIAGNTVDEYAAIARILEGNTGIAGIELNISCPNVKHGGMQFGTDPKLIKEVVQAVKVSTSIPVMPKLSPNVTDIVGVARAAWDGGADALSMINTLMGMAIDIKTRRPVLANTFGGLSGPAIKPVALRMVYQVFREVPLPILGGGGIMNAADALEFILAGATAVSIGTANFVYPNINMDIKNGIESYMNQNGISNIMELVGLAAANY
ncbi:MAG TPA: dihydroorotate dehydrogenase [Syntrophomonadaceae bacterium]|nr:dihydroorotate dehydrogenase [Syntrophomonadaceae bacterium]